MAMTMKTRLLFACLLLSACSGAEGSKGGSCHTQDTDEGLRVWCDDGSESDIENGQDGTDGEMGETGDRGPAGKTGPAGEDGADGADGDPATATTVIESFSCSASLDGSKPALSYSYNAVLWSSGDLFVAGTVRDSKDGKSNSVIYNPTQEGYKPASVVVSYDYDGTPNGGYFNLWLDRTTLVSHVEYVAAAGSFAAEAWTLQPESEACVHNIY